MAKKAGSDGANQPAGVGKSFDQYEYIAVITPGAALLFGLYLAVRPDVQLSSLKDIGLGSFGAFLVAAFVAGHLLRALGDGLEWLMWTSGGMPSDWVLYAKQKLVNNQQRNDLIARVNKRGFKFDEMKIADDDTHAQKKEKFEKWQGVTRQISIEVHDAKKAGRVDTFNRNYGLMVGITVALLIAGAVLLLRDGVDAIKLRNQPTQEAIAAIALAGFSLYRTVKFGKNYARELFVSFLDVTKDEKTRRKRAKRAATAARGGAKTKSSKKKKRR